MPISSENLCPICWQLIQERPRGSRHGHPPKTCSDACRLERKRRRERDRYHVVKGTDEWKSTRADYLRKLRARLDADPEFAAIFRAEAAARTREWSARLRASDPSRIEAMKSDKRVERKAWRERLESDPAAWEAHKAKCRAWYASLTAEERGRIYYAPRRKSMA